MKKKKNKVKFLNTPKNSIKKEYKEMSLIEYIIKWFILDPFAENDKGLILGIRPRTKP